MSVYLLYNQKKDVKLFIEADGYEEAVKTFKACKFKNSFEWMIYLKIGGQRVQTIGNK
mgnify:FL=1